MKPLFLLILHFEETRQEFVSQFWGFLSLETGRIFVGQNLNSRRSHDDVDVFVNLRYFFSD
jgi:hypothetical protein